MALGGSQVPPGQGVVFLECDNCEHVLPRQHRLWEEGATGETQPDGGLLGSPGWPSGSRFS